MFKKIIILLFILQINLINTVNYHRFVRFLHRPNTIFWAGCGAVMFCNFMRLGMQTDLFKSKKELEENNKRFIRELELLEEKETRVIKKK